MWEGVEGYGGVEEVAVVGFVLGNGEGEFSGGAGGAVQDVDERVAAFLAGETGEEDGGYVGVVDPGVDGADTWFISLVVLLIIKCLEKGVGNSPAEWITTIVLEQFMATLLTRLSLNSSVRLSRSKLSDAYALMKTRQASLFT